MLLVDAAVIRANEVAMVDKTMLMKGPEAK
jgi:hypothetical protein